MCDPSKAETLIAVDRTLGNIVARENLRRTCIHLEVLYQTG